MYVTKSLKILGLSLFALTAVAFQNCGKFQVNKAELESESAPLALDPAAPLNVNLQDSSTIQMQNAVVPVLLNKADADPIIVNYQTFDRSAKDTLNYSKATGSITIPAGQTAANLLVPVIDASTTGDLDFAVMITSVSKGSIGRGTSLFTILRGAVTKPKWHLFNPAGTTPGVGMRFTTWTGTKLLRFQEISNTSVDTFQRGFLLDPIANTQTPIPVVPLATRYLTSNAWAGNRLVVWGGVPTPTATTFFNDGALYDPVANTWTAMSSVNALSGRQSSNILTVGSKVIFLFGNTAGTYIPNGGVFDVATNSWTLTPTEPVRYNTQFVVAGNKILMWGGELPGIPYNQLDVSTRITNTGSIYDVATNTWTAMSLTGAPSRRYSPIVKWTGSKMLVLGGTFASGPFNNVTFTNPRDSGVYDPSTNTWTAMNMTGAPATIGRSEILNGKLYVFGSFTPAESGVYDPATNTWAPLNLQNAPSARVNCANLVVDSKYYVFGGQPSFTVNTGLNDGGVYDAAINTWTKFDTNGAPSPRGLPQMFWTGSALGIISGMSVPLSQASTLGAGDGGLYY